MKRSVLSLILLTISWVSIGQTNYTIRDYYNDAYLLNKSRIYFENKQFFMAEKLMNDYKSINNASAYYLKSLINFELKKPYESLLHNVFLLGIPNNLVDPNSAFFIENKSFFEDNFNNDFRTPEEIKISVLCERLYQSDQENKKAGNANASEIDIQNMIVLDSIITNFGWPTQAIVKPIGGLGPICIIGHQAYTEASKFEYYYRIVADKCLKGLENWTVAEFILEQRSQYMASQSRRVTVSDTLKLTFNNVGKIDENYAVPYFVALGKSIYSSSVKRLEFEVNNQELADEIIGIIYEFEQVSEMDPDIIKMLSDGGFDHPSPISPDRIAYGVNSDLPKDKVVYKFVKLNE